MDAEGAVHHVEESAPPAGGAATASGRRAGSRREWAHRLGVATLLVEAFPGFLLGTLFAQLLFFLNPHLRFDLPVIGRAVAAYGATGAVASFALLRLMSRGRRRRAWRQVPWAITLALCAAAVLGWVLPSYYAFYLQPAMNRRLIKAAVWLSATGLVCFYTALLHSLSRRRYGIRSRLGFVLCTAAAIAAMAERRGAYPTPTPPAGRPAQLEERARPPLLFVGIDSATLSAVLPLAEQGRLPFFAHLLENGAHGHLSSLEPFRSGSLWATLATGKLPYKHGIVGRWAFAPFSLPSGAELKLLPPFQPFRGWAKLGAGGRHLDAGDLTALPLWRILARVGLRTSVVGWPGSSPVQVEPAAMVSDDFFARPEGRGAIWPTELREPALALARVAQEAPLFAAGTLEGVAPGLLAQAGIADRWRLEVAEKLAVEGWGEGALFVTLPGLRDVSAAAFGGYYAAQLEGVRSPSVLAAEQAVETYYALLDRFLAELWQLSGERGLLVVASAYGAEPPRGWQWFKAQFSGRRALEGDFSKAPAGLLLMYGESVRPGVRLEDGELVDVVPTLLYALRLPIANDLDGKVLRHAFDPAVLARHPLTFLPSYEPAGSGAPP